MRTIKNIFYLTFLIISGILLGNCGGDSSVNAPQDFVTGTITFNGSNFYYSGGYYAVTIFSADSSNPFHRVPVKSDSLAITNNNGVYSAYYKTSGLSGNYYITSSWFRHSNNQAIVIGAYGCDTTVNCTTATIVAVPNYAGDGPFNFRSSVNPTRNIFP